MEIEVLGDPDDKLRRSIRQAIADGHAVRSAKEQARRGEAAGAVTELVSGNKTITCWP